MGGKVKASRPFFVRDFVLHCTGMGAKECPETPKKWRTMALSRKFLEGMGLEEKQVQAIVEANAESIEALKAERDGYKEQAAKVPNLQKQLEEAQKASADEGGWKEKYTSEHKAFEDFKTKVASEKAQADKAKAYRDMLLKANVDPKRIDAIMRVTDLSGVEMEDGKLKDADKLEEAAKTEWEAFVVKTKTKGADPENPPTGGKAPEGADPEIVKRLQQRHERMYGKDTSNSSEE